MEKERDIREQTNAEPMETDAASPGPYDRMVRIERMLAEMVNRERERGFRQVGLEDVSDLMSYQPWNQPQQDAGDQVRDTLAMAIRTIIRVAPRGRYRDRAIEAITDARMLANAAISFRGRF